MTNPIHTLTTLGIIAVSGKDTVTFLQGQMTCDVTQLSTHQASMGALCDAKGRIQSTFILFKDDTHHYLIVPIENMSITQNRLQKYALFSKVFIEDVTSHWHFIGLKNDEMNPLTGLLHITPEQNVYSIYLPGRPLRGFLLSSDYLSLQKVYEQHINMGFYCVNNQDWLLGNIHAGFANILPSTSGLFTPQMIGLEKIGGVSFKKGCYVGQEIIARTQHLGKLKRHLYRVEIAVNIAPQPGDLITNQQAESLGTFVNVCAKNPNLQHALAIIEDRALETCLFWQQYPLHNIIKVNDLN